MKLRGRNFSIILLFICNFGLVLCDDILGCGGFIKSHIPIEFSKVEVGLYTRQGSLKDVTDCAPNNGYYFLPLYDRGDYVLKVSAPEGWNFEPTEVSLSVDGETDACSIGRDINFVFVGFAVSGKVLSHGKSAGPTGVIVSLHLAGSGDAILQVITGAGGSYSFPRVAPGQYELRASHPEWRMSQDRASLTVSADSHQVIGSLSVAGYPVSGRVTSDSEPIAGVSFILHGEDGQKETPPGCQPLSKGLCKSDSGKDGRFLFPVLQPGKYRVVPHYATGKEGIAFDVRPTELRFIVEHGSVLLNPEFEVKGFTVTGKVLSSRGGAGIAGANIVLDGQPRTVTGEDGSYRLENMQAGSHKLDITADLLQFPSTEIRISPGSPVIPPVYPSAMSVCGTVTQHAALMPNGVAAGPRSVSAISLPQRSQTLTSSTNPNTGHYCILLPLGEYQLSVLVSDDEMKKGLKFSPATRKVSVVNRPLSGMDFSPLRATITGHVRCLKNCGHNLGIRLVSLDSDLPDIRQLVSDDGSYTFTDILPGQYDLCIGPDPNLCFEKGTERIVVSSAETTAPVFEQTGFNIFFASSHETLVDFLSPDTNKRLGTLKSPAGESSACVPGKGPYVLVPKGCHRFSESRIAWEPNGGVIKLKAIEHTLSGTVICSDRESNVAVTVFRDDGSSSVIGPLGARSSAGGFTHYGFDLLARPGEQLRIEPKAGSLIFTPSSASVTATSDCQASVATFKGEKGHFVEGKVSPPLENFDITITLKGEFVTKTTTDKKGKYRVGPLSAPGHGLRYEVTVEREGYLVSKKGEGSYEARKLAEVVVRVRDSADDSALPGVLLSLSGGDYRRNSQAGTDGVLAFHSLWPGDYFLRPKLKEYRFEPPSKMITVAEGATVNVDVSGRRVAFSCIGSVNSLSGEPEGGIVLEAVGIGEACKSQQEEAISEVSGHFRIRGLLPKCEYEVKMKEGVDGNQQLDRISPRNLRVKPDQGDVRNIRLLAMRPPQHCDVAVHVIPSQPGSALRLRVFRDDEPDVPMLERRLEPPTAPQHYLVLPPFPTDGKSYYVQVEPTSGSQQRKEAETQIVPFTTNSSFRYVRVQLGSLDSPSGGRGEDGEEEETKGSVFLLPLIVLIAMALFNRDKLAPLASQMAGGMRHLLSTTPSTTTITPPPTPLVLNEELIVEPVIKRKTKPRKT